MTHAAVSGGLGAAGEPSTTTGQFQPAALVASLSSGKMENYELIHSSRVKFTYPSEEEVGDLTFTVAQKMAAPEKAPALSILLCV